MAYPRRLHRAPRGLGDLTSVLNSIAQVAGQVQQGAQVASGGLPVLSFWEKNKWPLTIGATAVFTGIAVVLLTKHGKRWSR